MVGLDGYGGNFLAFLEAFVGAGALCVLPRGLAVECPRSEQRRDAAEAGFNRVFLELGPAPSALGSQANRDSGYADYRREGCGCGRVAGRPSWMCACSSGFANSAFPVPVIRFYTLVPSAPARRVIVARAVDRRMFMAHECPAWQVRAGRVGRQLRQGPAVLTCQLSD